MSMILELRRVSELELQRLVDDPSDIRWFLYGDEPPTPTPGFLARLFGKQAPPSGDRDWIEPSPEMVTDLDKAWHCIHYLLAGEAWEGAAPLGYLLVGGTTLGEIDVGYGPARALSAGETRAFADALNPITEADFRARYDPVVLAREEIYPAIWGEAEDEFPYIWGAFEDLREFVSNASQNGDGLVVYLS